MAQAATKQSGHRSVFLVAVFTFHDRITSSSSPRDNGRRSQQFPGTQFVRNFFFCLFLFFGQGRKTRRRGEKRTDPNEFDAETVKLCQRCRRRRRRCRRRDDEARNSSFFARWQFLPLDCQDKDTVKTILN